jgi:hypothetical protein
MRPAHRPEFSVDKDLGKTPWLLQPSKNSFEPDRMSADCRPEPKQSGLFLSAVENQGGWDLGRRGPLVTGQNAEKVCWDGPTSR